MSRDRGTGRRAPGAAALAVAALLVAVVAGGCAGGYPLPTAPRPPPGGFVCNMAGVSGTLEGRADDPSVAWIVNAEAGRVNVRWPWGFTATFQPDLVLVAPGRRVVARRGDFLNLAGGWIDTGFDACQINGTFYITDP